MPDPEELLRSSEPESRGPGRDPTLLDFGTSQLLPDSQTPSKRGGDKTLLLFDDNDDLGLDLGLDMTDRSIEVGRRAQTPRRDEPSFLNMDDDLGLDLGMDDTAATIHAPLQDNDIPMLDDEIAAANAAALARHDAAAERREKTQRARDSVSPLSSLRSSLERDLEQTFHLQAVDLNASPEEPSVAQARQQQTRIKRRKVLPQDPETELHNSQIKAQQADRSAITKAPSFLPRDPLLLQLMELQKRGGFVSQVMGDGRMEGWAPELRGILSLEVIGRAGERKRKRDSGVADLGVEEEEQGFEGGVGRDFGMDATVGADAEVAGMGFMSDGLQPAPAAFDDQQEDERPVEEGFDEAFPPPNPEEDDAQQPDFDITEAPLLHPSQSGPISLGTQHAVHLLRSHLAPSHSPSNPNPPTPSKRVKSEALFTDLCPEGKAGVRKDVAVKMFFELLVLGTKDAVQVEQEGERDGEKVLGGRMRVRGKRGLWGSWAERGVGASLEGRGEEGVEGEGEVVDEV